MEFRRQKTRKGERGQVAILFALVFTFMFILFAFVVDFGHLVNNKMNLQIAADAAAYAGASWQARTLNKIAMVNYHLRQDWKEMAMRVNVTHLRHNRNFPRGPKFYQGNDGPPQVDPIICQQAHGYQAISGLKYAADTNLCRNADPTTGGLPPIVVPPIIAAFDPYVVAVTSQLQRVQQAANQECRAAAEDNGVLADHLIKVFTGRSQFHANQIRTLVDWMNEINGQQPNENSTNPVLRAAFESAFRNLSQSNKDDIKIEVMHPTGGKYLDLASSNVRASMFYMNYQVRGDGCVGQPRATDFDSVTVNFFKKPEVVTYFAVKLTSKPKMLFMPEKWVESGFPELVAYAAAKPFGSRIGPRATTDELVPIPNRPGNASRLINFSFKPPGQDNLGILNTKVMAYLDALHPFNSVGRPDGNQITGWPEPNRGENLRLALQAIRAPTMFDSMFFTIFPDAGSNKQNDWEESKYAEALYPDYLESAGADNNIIQTPDSPTQPYFPQGVGSKNRGPGWIQINADGGNGGGPYGDYATEQVASHSTTGVTDLPQMKNPNEFGWATRAQINSGWAPEGKPGRIGYSVKFIGIDALVRTLRVERSDSSEGPIANPPVDPNINNIFH